MSREAFGDPPDPEPQFCPLCGEREHVDGCELLAMQNRAQDAESEVVRLRAALDALPRVFRAALLEEAAQWTGDYRVPAHRALCDAAKRARVPLTMDDCYRSTKQA